MAEVSLAGVSKSFGATRAVRDLTLTVPDGGFMVLVGPTGAGKTTALRLVAGLERPDAGRVGIGGEVAARISEDCFYSLEAPVLRVTGMDVPYPPSRVEEDYLPDLDRVLDAVDRSLSY